MSHLFSYAEALVLVSAGGVTVYVGALGSARHGTVGRGVAYGGLVGLWLIVIFEVARFGGFSGRLQPAAWSLIVAMVVPPLGITLRYLAEPRRPAAAEVAASLAAIQGLRIIVGALLLLTFMGGAVAPWLAFPAGVTELLTGAGGLVVGVALKRGGARATRLARLWATFAVVSGTFLLAATAAAAASGAYFLTLYPLALLPAFVVPMAVGMDVALLVEVGGGA